MTKQDVQVVRLQQLIEETRPYPLDQREVLQIGPHAARVWASMLVERAHEVNAQRRKEVLSNGMSE